MWRYVDIGQPSRQGKQGTHFRHFESVSPDMPSMANSGGTFVDVDTLEFVEPLNGEAEGDR